jgi:hypothetical protein
MGHDDGKPRLRSSTPPPAPPRAPLYDPTRAVDVDPADAVIVVHRFLEKCAAWAERREIPKTVDRVRNASDPQEAASQAARLHAWTSWLAFVRHAQSELRSGSLDRWFTPRWFTPPPDGRVDGS